MRNKKMAKRIAVAMLAAATTFSSVPAAAVFAADTSVEASDVTVNGVTTASWSVDGVASSDLDDTVPADHLKKQIGNALNGAPIDSTVKTDADAISVLQGTLTTLNGGTAVYTVKSTTLVSGKGNGNVVVDTSDGDTFTYTFTTATVMDSESAEANALTSLFDGITVKVYDGKTVNTATVQAALNTALTTARGDKNPIDFFKTGAGKDYKDAAGYTVKSATVSGDTVTGTIERTASGTTYSYSYTAALEQSKDSKAAIVDSAVSALAATEIPDAGDAGRTLTNIQAALNASLDDQGIEVSLTQAQNSGTDLYTAAKHGKTGSIVVFVDKASNPNAAVTFTLKESSAQKLTEADRKLKSQTVGSKAYKGIFGTVGLDALYLLKDDGTVDSTATADGVYTLASTSAISRAIQAKDATAASDKDAVKAGIEKAVADAVKEFDGDGVEYKTEIVDKKYLVGETDKDKADKYVDDAKDATVDSEGAYLVKVTASIANDFFNDSQTETTANPSTSKNTYYVLVKTGKLKEVKATKVALSDKTVALKQDTNFAGSTAADATKDSMTISLKPILTPADSNSKITWTITGKSADGKTSYTKDNDFKYDATTHGTDAAKLIVKQEGTYKVTAEYKGHKAEATITVKKNFKDVPATSAFANAVGWAYRNNITAGVSDDTFGSNESVTRAQFITWLYKEAVVQDPSVAIKDADVKSVFSDVATSKYYAKAVQWAVENKITSGTTATTFSPDQTITRAQAVTLLWNMQGKPDTGAAGSELESTLKFKDMPSNPAFKAAITWAVKHTPTITSGTTTTTFSPDQVCTRAQAVQFLYKTYGV